MKEGAIDTRAGMDKEGTDIAIDETMIGLETIEVAIGIVTGTGGIDIEMTGIGRIGIADDACFDYFANAIVYSRSLLTLSWCPHQRCLSRVASLKLGIQISLGPSSILNIEQGSCILYDNLLISAFLVGLANSTSLPWNFSGHTSCLSPSLL